MIADRFFSAEKGYGDLAHSGWNSNVLSFRYSFTYIEYLWIMFIYALCYNPTLALVNAISFNQMA